MTRYAIPSDKAIGVAMRDIKALGKTLGRITISPPHSGHRRLRGRMLASFVDDPRSHRRADGPLVQRLRQLGVCATP